MLPYFAATLFVSASLLFLVQPMVGKMILPSLGGTPAVWNTCMVFFQAVLLIGYGYTHSLSTWCSRRRQLLVQMAILLMPFAFLMLPFSMGNWSPPGDANPIGSVLWLLLGMVGLPFFVVATSAPLLQKWFADTGHAAGKDPYFLYGASNLGSMLALVLYPLVVEPLFPIGMPPQTAQTSKDAGTFTMKAGHGISSDTQVDVSWTDASGKRQRRSGCTVEAVQGTSVPIGAGVTPPFITVSGGSGADLPSQSGTAVSVAPSSRVWEQEWLWSAGYALLTMLIGGCVVLVWRAAVKPPEVAQAGAPAGNAPATPPVQAPKTAVQPVRRGRRPIGWKPPQASPADVAARVAAPAVTLRRRLRWLVLAAIPSSLMLGVTSFLTTDVAAIPFFWVIPLALYLLTFILVFSRWPVVWTDKPHTAVLYLQPFVLILVVMYLLGSTSRQWILIAFVLHVSLFFLTTLMCHGELAKDRPETRHLTEFYLWMSLGGVLGGVFNALLAPLIFRFGSIEYPLAMIGAYLLRPPLLGKYVLIPGDTDADEATPLGWALDAIVPVVLGLWTFLIFFTSLTIPAFNNTHKFSPGFGNGLELSLFDMTKVLTGMVVIGMFARPLRFGAALAAFALVALLFERHENPYLFEDRDFYGFVRVRKTYLEVEGKVREYNALIHGDIDHGWQAIDKQRRRDPLTYFHPIGGVGQVFDRFNWFGDKSDGVSWPDHRMPAALIGMGGSPLDPGFAMLAQCQSEPAYACIGLGIGTLGAHAKPFQFVRFYEIQPLVKHLSFPDDGSEPIFHFLQDARDRGANIEVTLGDGRLTLEKDRVEHYYHILVIDAFSSDAIPVHLLTKEALEMYLSKLAEGGLLVFNTTNRYVELNEPIRDLADKLDLSCYHFGAPNANQVGVPLLSSSDWVVLQRKNVNRSNPSFNGLAAMPKFVDPQEKYKDPQEKYRWMVPQNLGGPIWTDRYSNLLRVMSWR